MTKLHEVMRVLEINPDDVCEMTGLSDDEIAFALNGREVPKYIADILNKTFGIQDPDFKW
jgi:sulfur carrier protein ThiS